MNTEPTGGEIERRTLSDAVYAELLAEIVSGRLKPGDRLALGPLTTRFRVSATPVREALNRLSWDRFVDVYSQSRTEVAAWDASDMRERLSVLARVVGVIVGDVQVDLARLAACCDAVVEADPDLRGGVDVDSVPADVLAFLDICRVVGSYASDRVTGQLAVRFVAPIQLFLAGRSSERLALDLRVGGAARCAELLAAREAALAGDRAALRGHLDRLARLLESTFRSGLVQTAA